MQLSCLSVAVSASNASTTSSSRSYHITACFESGEEQDLAESHDRTRIQSKFCTIKDDQIRFSLMNLPMRIGWISEEKPFWLADTWPAEANFPPCSVCLSLSRARKTVLRPILSIGAEFAVSNANPC